MVNLNPRIKNEIQKLYNANYEVRMIEGRHTQMEVLINGPEDSPYSGAKYIINILLPDNYPFKSPSIGFTTRIFHPNVDEASGSICLDVLNQIWSPIYDLLNIVDILLPQLLSYPNAADPLNCEAGSMYLTNREKYNEIVRSYVKKYAIPITKEKIDTETNNNLSDEESLGF
ncbi:ubiquitin-conjugating enzyme E2 [Encephalitozoon romaleae SJ-2008]|uniref:Ubiquitin-conjugating enzyme E2 H n=1 Tax=Encephalitozoon romaleae (strain SJ-2008) TaxID=1178016 RepID=I6ZUU6_ENCRO|nr:ubiquitin-conjugating enzyme E2 [Encephalitozoon romaleae SJ-2008]AFN83501.1 ubiquitin-conjugating enzyme E2 [Encephalitozoon romaleae SJ-2008]